VSKASRIKACELAATVLAGRPDERLVPTAWSLAVFFESYIEHGSRWTMKDFGPKKPVKLRVAAREDQ
jgi:hypothetical protein